MEAFFLDILEFDLLGRLLLAALLGGLIGLERELSSKPAGLRTNLLICVGATLLMDLSLSIAAEANAVNFQQGVAFRADPARIAAQIVTGIGFLGAGTIMHSRGSVMGLTTAATIWVVAAIGMAVGARAYIPAIGTTILVGVSLVLLGRLEQLLVRKRRSRRYIFTLDADPALLEMVEVTFRGEGLRVETASVEKGIERYEASFDVTGSARRHEHVVRALVARSGVHRMTREY